MQNKWHYWTETVEPSEHGEISELFNDLEDWVDWNSPPWFRANLHVFKMYFQCIWCIFSMYFQCICCVFSMYLLCILNVFSMYLLCIFKIEMYLYSGALKIGGAGVKRGRQIEFMWFLSCWDLGVDLLRGPLGTSAPAYPDLCGLSRHNVGFHIFYPSLNMARLGYKKET